ncbi:dTDP-4-dehydrorhamnose 3,5-epimerase [Gilliamella sp. W8126]|uniref:dTDP-4-dehydrorhamnose 3,5-epimerase n=2 Tax=Gilliamella TaxID=1193503 RepID=A0A2V4DNC6_9GAMM|nr:MULTISPECIES: dTDP-4-dehydrorhamnose 3,5-epimerase [Gilliamella]MBI0005867.1 dTDP-4-dehydrorhamnose 3,5-epimerase [Gilliamella sp. W8126]PXY91535.1 dTDP-4-dehydrorhamnose 3,5-epimerase [Gilliamella apis]WLS93472.1 dTDP-4-dehydrorhamnose 3,5-epimerase [Gilliamella apis]
MQIFETKINGIKVIHPKVINDNRGYFFETFQKERYQKLLGINYEFVQDNFSRSFKNVLRGMHFQVDYPQGKLLRVVQGKVFDVAIDIRKDSPTFGQWVGMILSAENNKQLWVPPGFAHGFLVLSDIADFEYKCTNYYDSKSERCLLWNDPTINISWPISNPILSAKDKLGKSFEELF